MLNRNYKIQTEICATTHYSTPQYLSGTLKTLLSTRHTPIYILRTDKKWLRKEILGVGVCEENK